MNNPNSSSSQYADTLLCLSSEAMMAYIPLMKHIEEKNVQYAALAVRNLLEVAIWTEYCGKSKENAERFFGDAVRDVNGIMAACNRMSELATVLPDNWDSDRSAAESSLKRMAARVGIQEFDPNFLPVSEAAKEISPEIGIVFSKLNTILSKFVHPTAFSVKSVLPPKTVASLTSMFLPIGAQLITDLLSEVSKVALTLVSS